MEQVSPLTVLPTPSYIDFVPTVDTPLDYKTIFSVEQQRANAEYRKKQDQISNRIRIQTGIENKMFDPNSPMGMVGENPWQNSVLDKVKEGIMPYYQEMEQIYSSGNYDENALLNVSSKMSNYLLNNQEFKKVIAQKNKYANYKKVASGAGFDPDAVAEFDAKYYGYEGGDDPLDSFNPAMMKALDLAKVNNNLKSIYDLDEKRLMENGYEGYAARPADRLVEQLEPIWEANKYAYERQGIDKNTWMNTRIKEYYDNFDANGIRYTEGATKAMREAMGETTDSSGTKKSTSTSSGDAEKASIQVGPDGRIFVPNTVRNAHDGLPGGSEQDINNPAIAPTQKLQSIEDTKTELNAEFKNVVSTKDAIIAKHGKIYNNWSEAVKKQWGDLTERQKELGHNLRSLDESKAKIKEDGFYKSPEYKEYKEHGGGIGTQIQYGMGYFSTEEERYFDAVSEAIGEEGNGAGNIATRQINRAGFYNRMPRQVDEKIKHIEAYKAEAVKQGKSPKPFDEYIKFIKQGEDKAYEAYAARVGIDAKATASTTGYVFDPLDPDVKAITNKFDGKDGQIAINNSKGGIKYVDGKEYVYDKDDVVVTTSAVFDPTTGTYKLRGMVGKPLKNEDDTIQKDFNGQNMLEQPKEILISDANVNSQMLSIFLADTNPNDGIDTRGADLVAQNLFPRLAKTVDVNDGAITTFQAGNRKYVIKKGDGEGYLVTEGSDTFEVTDKLDLARVIAARLNVDSKVVTGIEKSPDGTSYYVPIYKDGKLVDPATNKPANTSGGGNGKKSLGVEERYMDLFKTMARAEETKAYSEEASYLAINNEPVKDSTGKIVAPPTNALGKYQLLPYWQGDKIIKYIGQHPELLSNNQRYISPTNIRELATKLGRFGDRGYSTLHMEAYLHFLNNPKLQDKFMTDVLLKEYQPDIPKVMEVYAKKGMHVNEAEAIDMIHHNGADNAKKGIGLPRDWAKTYSLGGEEKTVNISAKSYTFQFQDGISLKGLKPELKDAVGSLIPKLGIETQGLVVSSAQRDWGADQDHHKGAAIDFVGPGPHSAKRERHHEQIIKRIAAKMDDPAEAERVLLSGKGKVNGGEPLLVEVDGQLLKIIYHKNHTNDGNHFHIELAK